MKWDRDPDNLIDYCRTDETHWEIHQQDGNLFQLFQDHIGCGSHYVGDFDTREKAMHIAQLIEEG